MKASNQYTWGIYLTGGNEMPDRDKYAYKKSSKHSRGN